MSARSARARRNNRVGARRRARGAALVETVVVVPLFILLFAGMLFLHHVIAKTQQTQLAARSAAWQEAMSGCSGGPKVITPEFSSLMDGAPGSEVSLTAASGQARGSSAGTVAVSVLGSGHAEGQSEGLSFTRAVHSTAIVMCNAHTQPGDIPGAFHWFVNGDLIGNIFGGP